MTVGVLVVGPRLAAHLRDAGRTDAVVLDREVTGAVFDETADSWTLTCSDGQTCQGRVVIAGSPFTPWIPPLAGRDEFRGVSLHAAAPEPAFDPAGRRVAVLGTDAGAGQFIERTARSAAAVTVFALPPRRVVSPIRTRWRRRSAPPVITAPIDRLTASGIRTCDGAQHDVDAIVYGTGFTIAAHDGAPVGAGGVTLAQTWRDGMEPYLGVAVHGLPNYFFIGGPDPQAQARVVVGCLDLLNAGSRIEVRASSQQVFNERVHLSAPRHRPAASAFDLAPATAMHEEIYDGAAMLTTDAAQHQVRVRLTGHVEPFDGQYHWQGTIFDPLPDSVRKARTVTLAVGDRTAPARITDRTPQDRHSIAGVGTPPFALGDVEFTVPRL